MECEEPLYKKVAFLNDVIDFYSLFPVKKI